MRNQGLRLASVVSFPTLGLYLFSSKYKSLADLPEGASIGVSFDPVNLAHSLSFARDLGIITLKADSDDQKTSIADIGDNPRNFTFVPMEAAQLSRSLESIAAAVVPGGCAYFSGMDFKSALAMESLPEPLKLVGDGAGRPHGRRGQVPQGSGAGSRLREGLRSRSRLQALRPA